MMGPSRARITIWSSALVSIAFTNVERPDARVERQVPCCGAQCGWWRVLRVGCSSLRQQSWCHTTTSTGGRSASLPRATGGGLPQVSFAVLVFFPGHLFFGGGYLGMAGARCFGRLAEFA